jgi:hypothetical protein
MVRFRDIANDRDHLTYTTRRELQNVGDRSVAQTRAPVAESLLTTARPTPPAAPETTIVLPARSNGMMLLSPT